MTEVIAEEEALRRYPELELLVSIRQAGWRFRRLHQEDQLIGIAGSLSRERYTDAVFVFDRGDISAARVLDDDEGGGCVWSMTGSDLREVLGELLGLPEPGERGAPTIVRRHSGLWSPR
jgi:hypothetical protein